MLHVVIADDEERICRLIEALGEWSRLGLEVAGVAHTGPDALEMVRALQPDILITDIRMPGLNGLDVIAKARELSPGTEVIIISGYAQFDYAQTAIRYAVGEYLLKPINQAALNHSLEKMAARCRQRQKSETDIASLRTGQMDDWKQLRARLATDLAAGRLMARTAEDLEREYHFHASEGAYRVFLLQMDGEGEEYDEAATSILRLKICEVLRPVLEGACADAAAEFAGDTLVGVANYAPQKQDAFRARLRDGLNQLVGQRGLFGAVRFSLALGSACASPQGLPASYRNAAEMLSERLIEGTERLLEGEAAPSGLLSMDFQTRYAQEIAHAIEMLSVSEADQAADALSEAASTPGARGWELLELIRGAGTLFIMRLGSENAEQEAKAFADRCERCGSLRALTQGLKDLQREQLSRAAQQRRDRDAQPIRDAKLYIRKHFASPITLEEVSAAIGFSVNYFSTLFKKETGEGFAKYLTRVRMEAARGMLRDTRDPIAEICRQVGYGDIKHFTRTFKAETGVTPGEYRKLYG